jgi:hypothetical protein
VIKPLLILAQLHIETNKLKMAAEITGGSSESADEVVKSVARATRSHAKRNDICCACNENDASNNLKNFRGCRLHEGECETGVRSMIFQWLKSPGGKEDEKNMFRKDLPQWQGKVRPFIDASNLGTHRMEAVANFHSSLVEKKGTFVENGVLVDTVEVNRKQFKKRARSDTSSEMSSSDLDQKFHEAISEQKVKLVSATGKPVVLMASAKVHRSYKGQHMSYGR